MGRETLQASEIAQFLFCRRAWWYARHGQRSLRLSQQRTGTDWHRLHGWRVRMAEGLRRMGYALLIIGTLACAWYIAARLLG